MDKATPCCSKQGLNGVTIHLFLMIMLHTILLDSVFLQLLINLVPLKIQLSVFTCANTYNIDKLFVSGIFM